jgi:hypothetical protein
VLRNIAAVKEQQSIPNNNNSSSSGGSIANSVQHQMNAALQSASVNHLTAAAIHHSAAVNLNVNVNYASMGVYDGIKMFNNQNWPRNQAWLTAKMRSMQQQHSAHNNQQSNNQLTNVASDHHNTSPIHSALHQHNANSIHQQMHLDAHHQLETKPHLTQLNGNNLHQSNQHNLHAQSNQSINSNNLNNNSNNLQNQQQQTQQNQLAQQFYGQHQLLNHMTGNIFSSANSTGGSSSGALTPVHLTATTPTQPNSQQCATPATTITDKLNDEDSCSGLLSDDCDGVNNSTPELEVASERRMQHKKKLHRNRTTYTPHQKDILEKGKLLY